jgi:hypothetical protein
MEASGCHYEILAHNTNGYIVFCLDCNNYQLGFGTTVLTLSGTELTQFRHKVYQLKTEANKNGTPDQKTIRVPLGVARIRMALTTGEASQLLLLIDEAAATSVFGKLMEELEWK